MHNLKTRGCSHQTNRFNRHKHYTIYESTLEEYDNINGFLPCGCAIAHTLRLLPDKILKPSMTLRRQRRSISTIAAFYPRFICIDNSSTVPPPYRSSVRSRMWGCTLIQLLITAINHILEYNQIALRIPRT